MRRLGPNLRAIAAIWPQIRRTGSTAERASCVDAERGAELLLVELAGFGVRFRQHLSCCAEAARTQIFDDSRRAADGGKAPMPRSWLRSAPAL